MFSRSLTYVSYINFHCRGAATRINKYTTTSIKEEGKYAYLNTAVMYCMGSATTSIDIQRDKLMKSEEKHAGFRMRRNVFI